jgi:hypothetical protein
VFDTLQVLRSERPAMCPECKVPKHTFVRSTRGTMCISCAGKPSPLATLVDIEDPSRKLGLVVRHGAPVVCVGCEKAHAVFSLSSGLCIACTK